jgi:hypothetical protein
MNTLVLSSANVFYHQWLLQIFVCDHFFPFLIGISYTSDRIRLSLSLDERFYRKPRPEWPNCFSLDGVWKTMGMVYLTHPQTRQILCKSHVLRCPNIPVFGLKPWVCEANVLIQPEPINSTVLLVVNATIPNSLSLTSKLYYLVVQIMSIIRNAFRFTYFLQK